MSEREYAARLIVGVLTGTISVKEALLNYPKDNRDKNLLAGYHALAHYEADEDLRNNDLSFKEEQDEYLYMIAELFANGKDLPLNIIKSYESYYPEFDIPKPKYIINLINSLKSLFKIK